MKIVLDLKTSETLSENDIIVYKDDSWCVISKESFLANHTNENRKKEKELDDKINLVKSNLEEEIKKIQKDLVSLAKIVKEK